MGKQEFPRYSRSRRAGALESQGKPRETHEPQQSSKLPVAQRPKQERSWRAEAGAWEESTVLRWRAARQRGTHKSQIRNLYSEDRGNLKGYHCGSFSTGFRGGPGDQRASMMNGECRELKLCRAHIKPFKNVSLFFFLCNQT